MLFLERGGIRFRLAESTDFDFLLIVSFGIERRVNVDEVNLPTVFFQEMAHHLEVVTPEDFVHPAVFIGFAEGLLQLCWKEDRAAEGAFASPMEFGEAFDGGGIDEVKCKLFYHCFILWGCG